MSNVQAELTDLLKYWLVLANVWGMTPEAIVDSFHAKNRVVEQRWAQEMNQQTGKPIVCIDIDGVLCDYVSTWERFLDGNKILYHRDPLPYGSPDIALRLGLDIKRYPELKHRFREEGWKKDADVIDGAQDFLQAISAQYHIVIVSARPALEYQRIYADTIDWFHSNGLKYDSIVFETDKREWVLKNKDRIEWVVEDDPVQASRIAMSGVKVFLLDKEYNEDLEHPNIVRVYHLLDIYKNDAKKG
jgi:uncharacterized HAD superfamily protein